ncbi:MAG: Xaa-Pro peptidase family protein [Candidatus Omnitrophica bacterium]|nr:Xaa-Pro peptidase family protein [Candidatus Omnitrophota bacterium]MCM8827736.1 Xaa-Pro peptidase family protein [Candidatus Omnitrophota bacterium]
MEKYHMPDDEFKMRWEKAQEKMQDEGLDLLLAHSNESDFANVRYLSDYWPIFESAGVIVPLQGNPALLIGPESETFASDRSRIKKIYKLVEYRESAEPDYPDIKVDTFSSIFNEILPGKKIRKLGLAGYAIFPLPVYESLKKAIPDAEIVRSDIISDLRIIKSPLELKMLQESFRISEIALKETLKQMKPEMTELEAVGIIENQLYANGAEYESHPQYVLSGKNSTHAIGRPGYQKLGKGKLIQLNVGARVCGYSGSVGRPVCFGGMPAEMRRLVQAGLDLHFKTMEWMKEGVIAKDVTRKFFEYGEKLGVRENLLYGPCHGLGMMEVERPWMESHSDYPLEENMTFQVDTFLYCSEFGLRWENGVVVKKDGVRPFSDRMMEIIEL